MSIQSDLAAHHVDAALSLSAAQAVTKNPAATAAQIRSAMITHYTNMLAYSVKYGVSNGSLAALRSLGADPGSVGTPANNGKVT